MNKFFLLILSIVILSGCSEPASEVELVLDTKSALGEGAIWNYKTQKLLWVNITGKILNIYNPQLGINKELLTGQMIGTVVPCNSGKVIVALQNGIYSMDILTGSKTLIANPESEIPGNRFNDGKCDPAGRFWAGTMNMNASGNDGALYRMDADGSISKMISNVAISNGIVWSTDKKFMYYIDTPTQKVKKYEYDNESGAINNATVVVEIPEELGSPDGMTIDSEGNLWIALWGGHAVGCWNPATGKLIQKIEVPAKNVTSCAFGGSDLKTLYITTARESTTDEELEKYPFAGGLFKIRTDVAGVNANFFQGNL